MRLHDFISGKLYCIPQVYREPNTRELVVYTYSEKELKVGEPGHLETVDRINLNEMFIGLAVIVLETEKDLEWCEIKILTSKGFVGWIEIWIEDLEFINEKIT